jgi:hypothetical protein
VPQPVLRAAIAHNPGLDVTLQRVMTEGCRSARTAKRGPLADQDLNWLPNQLRPTDRARRKDNSGKVLERQGSLQLLLAAMQ